MRRAIAAAGLVLCCGALGCATKQVAPPPPPTPIPTPVVMPTVPPVTPIPEGAAPLPTRPIKNPKAEAEKRKGKDIGPVVTFAGVARADGRITQPTGKNAQGIPVFEHPVGSGFILVVEGKPGISNVEVGRSIYRYDAQDPTQRPDLEIEVNRMLGDGSTEVCDARRPKIGGVPAIDPVTFAETAKVTAALNDLSCRFETFIESIGACTVEQSGDFSFARPDTKVQFCMTVARSWGFQDGDTMVSVRLRDTEGNPGPVSHFVFRRKDIPTPAAKALATPTPTVSRRRP